MFDFVRGDVLVQKDSRSKFRTLAGLNNKYFFLTVLGAENSKINGVVKFMSDEDTFRFVNDHFIFFLYWRGQRQ